MERLLLRNTLAEEFNVDELKLLCFELNVNYDHISGDNSLMKSTNLVLYFEQRETLPALETKLRQLRPMTFSENVPTDHDSQSLRPPTQAPQRNPFGIKGKINDPAQYIVRQPLSQQIFDELAKGSSLSIVGESQMGKSSLLLYVLREGPRALGRLTENFVYLDMQLLRSDTDFYDDLCHKLGLPVMGALQLGRALGRRRIVCCIDEIEKMTWQGFTVDLRTELRGLADGPDAPLSLLIASRSPLDTLFPDSPTMTSPLASLCLQQKLLPFTLVETHTLTRALGAQLPADTVAAAWAQSQGHAARLQDALRKAFAELNP